MKFNQIVVVVFSNLMWSSTSSTSPWYVKVEVSDSSENVFQLSSKLSQCTFKNYHFWLVDKTCKRGAFQFHVVNFQNKFNSIPYEWFDHWEGLHNIRNCTCNLRFSLVFVIKKWVPFSVGIDSSFLSSLLPSSFFPASP